MADLKEIKIDEQKVFNSLPFPLVYSPGEDLKTIENIVDYIKNESNRKIILDKLVQHGAILFRGFPVKDPKDFNEFALAFGWKDLPYVGGIAPRKNVVGVVFTANEAPPEQEIGFHHEMSYAVKYPSNLLFYCDVPPKGRGETPIVIASVVYEKINNQMPDFLKLLKEKGIRHTRVVPEVDDPSSQIGRGWRSSFPTESKEEIEEKLRAQGSECEWLPNGCLKITSKIFPVTVFDEKTGQERWFNSIDATWQSWNDSRNSSEISLRYGDFSIIDRKAMEKYHEILKDSCVEFKWQQGDVLLIDNNIALHARNSFVPPRRILAALFE